MFTHTVGPACSVVCSFLVRLAFEGSLLRASVLLDVVGDLLADLLLGEICYTMCLVAIVL